jgi:hypothetical protein
MSSTFFISSSIKMDRSHFESQIKSISCSKNGSNYFEEQDSIVKHLVEFINHVESFISFVRRRYLKKSFLGKILQWCMRLKPNSFKSVKIDLQRQNSLQLSYYLQDLKFQTYEALST